MGSSLKDVGLFIGLVLVGAYVLLCLFMLFAGIAVFFAEGNYRRKARKINAKLYGTTSTQCVLCPVCKGWVFISIWQKHIERNHGLQYVKPIEQELHEAINNIKGTLSNDHN